MMVNEHDGMTSSVILNCKKMKFQLKNEFDGSDDGAESFSPTHLPNLTRFGIGLWRELILIVSLRSLRRHKK